MEKNQFLAALAKAKEQSKKRNFGQSIDLVINLQNVDLKTLKMTDSIELPHGRGREMKIVVIADGEAALQAKKAGADLVVSKADLSRYQKKDVKKLARTHEWFVVQAQAMQSFASSFGAVLGPRGKMPYPKDILTPTGDPTSIIKRLRTSVRIRVKDRPMVHAPVGTEAMKDAEVAENAAAIYNAVLHRLEKGVHSIAKTIIKTTMGKPVVVE